MRKVKQINIKNPTYYFYNDKINLKNFDAKLLKINKKDYIEIDIYYINYATVKKIANCNNINSVNPSYLMTDEMIGYFECNSIECNSIEEKNKTKYLILDDVDENKEVLKNFKEFLEDVKKEIETMVAKKLNMENIFKKLGLNLVMICHRINL